MKVFKLVFLLGMFFFVSGCEKFDDSLIYVQMVNNTASQIDDVKLKDIEYGSIQKDGISDYKVVDGTFYAYLTPVTFSIEGEKFAWQGGFCGTGAIPVEPGKYQYKIEFLERNGEKRLYCNFVEVE